MSPPVTRLLAEWASSLRLEDVPPEVVDKVVVHAHDQWGAQALGATMPPCDLVRAYAAEESAAGPASAVGMSAGVRAEWAAFSNATAGTAFENDDYHPAALIHPGALAVAPGLAVAEELDASGPELLCALIAGFEVAVRLGIATQPSMNFERGIHPTAALGGFAGAAVAGRLRRLDDVTLTHAFGIAGSYASGTLEYSLAGGLVKRLHAGIAAQAGVRAAALAARGLTGPATVLEGPRGIFQAFAGRYDAERAVARLGDQWHLLGTAVKPYFCNGLIQAPVEALRELHEEEPIDAGEVEEVVIGVDRMAHGVCGTVGAEPADLVTAQFSLAYAAGLRLARGGNDAAHYREAAAHQFRLPDVQAIARRVRVEIDAEADQRFPAAFMAHVTVRLRGGTVRERRVFAPGTSENPIAGPRIIDKCRANVTAVLGEHRAGELMSLMGGLHRGTTSPSQLGAALRTIDPTHSQ